MRFCDRSKKYLLCAPKEGKYHNFDENLYQKHFYIAAAQFYKMLLKKPTWRRAETIKNQSEAIASIEYLVNETTLETFNSKKQFFQEAKRGLDSEGNVKELLLFHGTHPANVDSIAENNFAIAECGRGVYMSEDPQHALSYGDTLILSRVIELYKIDSLRKMSTCLQVLPGEAEIQERIDGKWIYSKRSAPADSTQRIFKDNAIHVIKTEAQILPYCILHLARQNTKRRRGEDQRAGNRGREKWQRKGIEEEKGREKKRRRGEDQRERKRGREERQRKGREEQLSPTGGNVVPIGGSILAKDQLGPHWSTEPSGSASTAFDELTRPKEPASSDVDRFLASLSEACGLEKLTSSKKPTASSSAAPPAKASLLGKTFFHAPTSEEEEEEDDEEALRAILLIQVAKAQTKKPIQDPVKEIQGAEKTTPAAVKEAVKEDASKATNLSVLAGENVCHEEDDVIVEEDDREAEDEEDDLFNIIFSTGGRLQEALRRCAINIDLPYL